MAHAAVPASLALPHAIDGANDGALDVADVATHSAVATHAPASNVSDAVNVYEITFIANPIDSCDALKALLQKKWICGLNWRKTPKNAFSIQSTSDSSCPFSLTRMCDNKVIPLAECKPTEFGWICTTKSFITRSVSVYVRCETIDTWLEELRAASLEKMCRIVAAMDPIATIKKNDPAPLHLSFERRLQMYKCLGMDSYPMGPLTVQVDLLQEHLGVRVLLVCKLPEGDAWFEYDLSSTAGTQNFDVTRMKWATAAPWSRRYEPCFLQSTWDALETNPEILRRQVLRMVFDTFDFYGKSCSQHSAILDTAKEVLDAQSPQLVLIAEKLEHRQKDDDED